ncbi:MAG: hypothetical protein KAI43_12055 [Candidatus Aureabacteria bacterium]|nr:hypothetical protein [Candidatus Auribacterota bacterium]
MKRSLFSLLILSIQFLAFTGCQQNLFTRKPENIVEKAEKQRKKADMIITFHTMERIFIDKPLLNIRNNIQHPFDKNKFIKKLNSFNSRQKIVVVILEDSWNVKDISERSKTIQELELLLNKYFNQVIFHQEQKYSYSKILKE